MDSTALGRSSASPTISGETLRTRIRRLGLTYTEAAPRLGLSLAGLNKQMNGPGRVGRQTELVLTCLEQHQRADPHALVRPPRPTAPLPAPKPVPNDPGHRDLGRRGRPAAPRRRQTKGRI
jgi:hypothetical protein